MIRAQLVPAILLTLVITILTGIVFPFMIWGISQLFFSYQANGSLIIENGNSVGSELIGQSFTSARYFHSRPSAAGSGYDPKSSGGTNLGPTSNKLILGIDDNPETSDVDESFLGVDDLVKAFRKVNNLQDTILIPPDAVTRSASGLDPHISPENAKLQAARIAKERGISSNQVLSLITNMTEGRFLGIFGEPRVNVLRLNLSLDELKL